VKRQNLRAVSPFTFAFSVVASCGAVQVCDATKG